jgi:CheY-like chemotaxis protein
MSMPEHKTILPVEDEVFIATAGAKILKQFGYKVTIANSGEKAVRLASENENISLIFMDIDLGKGIDGAEATRQILSGQTLPIVFPPIRKERW